MQHIYRYHKNEHRHRSNSMFGCLLKLPKIVYHWHTFTFFFFWITVFGVWGAVCDDQFGMNDANVVCRQLGFKFGASHALSNSPFGAGRPILMDNVKCLGNETSLADWSLFLCLFLIVSYLLSKVYRFLSSCLSRWFGIGWWIHGPINIFFLKLFNVFRLLLLLRR